MKNLLLIALAVFAFASCSPKNAPANATDVEIVEPCFGVEFQGTEEAFRASGLGVSTDQALARQKAMTAARAALAAQIEVTVKTVTDDYVSAYTSNQDEEVRGRYQSLTREVTNQQLQGIKTICSKMMKSPEGKYKAYVALELGGEELLNQINTRLSDDDKLRTDYEYEKFKEVFDAEMKAMENR